LPIAADQKLHIWSRREWHNLRNKWHQNWSNDSRVETYRHGNHSRFLWVVQRT